MMPKSRTHRFATLAMAGFASSLTAATADAQTYGRPDIVARSTSPAAGWSGYAPATAWGGYAPNVAAPLSSPATTAPRVTYYVPSTSADPYAAWRGYDPASGWVGYRPARAWVGYRPGGIATSRAGLVGPAPRAIAGVGSVASPIYNYRELGTGRNVPTFKPWLPGGSP